MAVSVGEVEATLRLRDEMSGQIGGVVGRIAELAAGFASAEVAIALLKEGFHKAIDVFKELTLEGARIADVSENFTHLTASAGHLGDALISTLKAGTHGTITDFELMKSVNRDLAAGVNLTDQQFRTLAAGAFALAKVSGTSVAEAFETMNNAMITGRVRAVALLTGKIDITAAEEKYAEKLHISATYLTADEKLQAVREALLTRVTAATERVGTQTEGLNTKVAQAQVAWQNFQEELAKTVARSPVLAAGFDGIKDALASAFGGHQEALIATIAKAIDQVAIYAVNFGLAGIEAARVINVAWSGIKTVVFGVETVVVGLIAAVGEALLAAERLAAKLHLVDPSEVAQIQATQEALRGLASGLAQETAEAAKGLIGHSEFDKTLDKLGGTLMVVSDRMKDAAAAQAAHTKATKEGDDAAHVHAANLGQLATLQEALSASTQKRQKYEDDMWKIEEKSLKETEVLWNEYFQLRVEHSGTTREAQKADINKWFDDEVAKLNDDDRAWTTHYAAIEAVAKEKLDAIGSNWSSLREKSQEALREQADAAMADYDRMTSGSLHFTREALDEQLHKVRELEAAARGMGKTFTDAQDAAIAHAKELAKAAADAKRQAEEARAANLAMGGSFEITRENFAASARGLGQNPDLVEELLKKGYSFQQALLYARHPEWPPPQSPGPRVPGFATGVKDFMGGLAVVGEQGPELVQLPKGSNVVPPGQVDTVTGTLSVTNNIYVNGTAAEVARKVADEIMRSLKMRRQLGFA